MDALWISILLPVGVIPGERSKTGDPSGARLRAEETLPRSLTLALMGSGSRRQSGLAGMTQQGKCAGRARLAQRDRAFYIPPPIPKDQRAPMFDWFWRLFVWWRGATPGTFLTTWLSGVLVGTDEQGNRYYQSKDGRRRWVIYQGTVEASRVPPEWHGWLHHTFKEPPTVAPFKLKPWEKEHRPNLTGTPEAWRPQGSLAREGVRPRATGDYQAWQPE